MQLKAVVTVTTDLGETFHPENLDLVATIRDTASDGDVYLRRKVHCPAYSRAVPISFSLSRNDVDWPACLHVSARPSASRSTGFLLPVVDIWSFPLNPTKGHFDSGHRVERRFTAANERSISLIEEVGDSIARHLWDGSQVLAQLIDETISMHSSATPMPLLEYVLVSATYRRLIAIELGCGCGTVGLSIAQAIPDCDIVLTDLPDVQPLAAANIARLNPAINAKANFVSLDWEEPLPKPILSRTHDLIIVSECTYNTATLPALVSTLLALLVRSPKAIILVSTKTRHPDEATFFTLMSTAGLILDSSARIPLAGVPGDGYADAATDVGVHIFHGQGHRLSLSPRGSESEVYTRGRTRGAIDRAMDREKVKETELGKRT